MMIQHPMPIQRNNGTSRLGSVRSGMIISVVLVLTMAAVLPVTVPAREKTAPPPTSTNRLKQQVKELLPQLDSDAFRERRSAERALLALGPRILPLLPAPELAPSPSVREAVKRIRVKLEFQKARESVRGSQVTLKTKQSLSKVLSEIETLTGNRIDDSQLSKTRKNRKISIDFQQRSFWAALDDLAARAGFEYVDNAELGSLSLQERVNTGQPEETTVAYSGPFRISVDSTDLKPLRGDDTFQLLRVTLGLRIEPRLRPLFVRFSGRDLTASNSEGNVLEPFSPEAQYELPLGEAGKSVRLQAQFKVPAAIELGKIALRGRLQVQTAADSERFEFTKLAELRRQARRRGGVTVMLRNVKFSPAVNNSRKADIRIAVSYDTGGPAFESHRTWMFHNQVFLLTTNAEPIPPSGPLTTELQADGAVAVGYSFAGLKENPADYRFVYVAPTLVLDVPLEFEIRQRPVSNK